jgi:hypothetical protein
MLVCDLSVEKLRQLEMEHDGFLYWIWLSDIDLIGQSPSFQCLLAPGNGGATLF